MHAPARLIVLKAFMRRGSVCFHISTREKGLLHLCTQPGSEHTRKANHPISLRDRPNGLLCRGRFPIVPSVGLFFRNAGEVSVQLGRLFVVFGDGLVAVRAESVFKERVDVDWGTDGVDGSDVWSNSAR